jgi:hypothetical protein
LPEYAESTFGTLDAVRGMADDVTTGRPEDFATRMLDIVATDGPTPLRIPIGADAYAFLEAVEQASREELTAARTLALGPPQLPSPAL